MTAADLASKVQVPLDTLRTWLKQNRFPRERAVSIAKLLNLGANLDEIAAAYDLDFTKLGGRPPKPIVDSEVVVTIGEVSIRFSNTDPDMISKVTAAISARLGHLSAAGDRETSSNWKRDVVDYRLEPAID